MILPETMEMLWAIGVISPIVLLGLFLGDLSIVTLVAFLYNQNPKRYFKVALFFARRGYYRHSGQVEIAKSLGIPVAKVYFSGGGLKGEMALGDAVVYAMGIQGTIESL